MDNVKKAQEKLRNVVKWTFSKLRKRIYYFEDGSKEDKELLGVKGSSLCEVHHLNIPVPPGFIITSEVCKEMLSSEDTLIPVTFRNEYEKAVNFIERKTGRCFGGTLLDSSVCMTSNETLPLLLSIRPGACVRMPGMMETILNLGLNDETVVTMARISQNPRWAYDTYRRFLQNFGSVVLGVDRHKYEDILAAARTKAGVAHTSGLTDADLLGVIHAFKQLAAVPADPWEQLHWALSAVYATWHAPRAVKYRELHHIPPTSGVSITIQAMVYGNINQQSGCGVIFSRNPSTGGLHYGEFLSQAEGDDLGSGGRTPDNLFAGLGRDNLVAFKEVVKIAETLEAHFKDVQEVEFTVENGKVYVLQSSAAERSPQAAVHIAISLVNEKVISERQALSRLQPSNMDYFLHSVVDPKHTDPTSDEYAGNSVVGRGLPVNGGAAVGQLVFTSEEAVRCAEQDIGCILCREHPETDDIVGFMACQGVLALHGGATSHSAVLLRDLDKPAVFACKSLSLCDSSSCGSGGESSGVEGSREQEGWKKMLVNVTNSVHLHAGDWVTIDGSTGEVYKGKLDLVAVGRDERFTTIMRWTDKHRRLAVTAAIASTPDQRHLAREYGCDAIGLCKTEEMLLRSDRINLMRLVLLYSDASDADNYKKAEWLKQLMNLHTRDFIDLFRAMDGRKVTVRLLNCPPKTFLPLPQDRSGTWDGDTITIALAAKLDTTVDEYVRKVRAVYESDPALGCRGARLSVLSPEITAMHIKAVVVAIIEAQKLLINMFPAILIPNIASEHEAELLLAFIQETVAAVCAEQQVDSKDLRLQLGMQLDTPRAVMRAGEIAALDGVDFVALAIEDLTQCVHGITRTDRFQFMADYLEMQSPRIFAADPFLELDITGVGAMVDYAVRKCREQDAHLPVHVVVGNSCADTRSVTFLDSLGVTSVCCSPQLLPATRLAAAQAHINNSEKKTLFTFLGEGVQALLAESL